MATSKRKMSVKSAPVGPLEDPTTDSMFNLADPQTEELVGEEPSEDRSRLQDERRRKKKTAKSRKTA